MYKLIIEYTDQDQLSPLACSLRTFAISTMLADYDAYGCQLNSTTIVFDCNDQRDIAMMVIGDDPNISSLRLG